MRTMAHRWKERPIEVLLLACALVSVLITAGVIYILAVDSFDFFRQVSPFRFLFGRTWEPQLSQQFGVLPLLCGTLLVAVGALIIAVPVGLASAIFLSEYAPRWVRQIFKPILEILAGVPTIVFGYFALTFITPYILKSDLVKSILGPVALFNALSGAIVVGIMIIPTISSLCDDAFRAVPRTLREAGYALSATRLEVSARIVLPASMSGVAAALLLALGRAIGETMAVALATGMQPNLTLDPRQQVQTMTSYIVEISTGDAPVGTIEYKTIFAVGITLFLITLATNLIAQRFLGRFREAYE